MKNHRKKANHQFVLLALVTLASFNMAFAQGGGVEAQLRKAQACSAINGQLLIDEGHYEQAVREFTCLIEAHPTDVEGYRGRSEALLLLGRYSDAFSDYARITAWVLPVQPNASDIILNGYAARLAIEPDNIPALTGLSFARWVGFDYAQAIHVLNHLIEVQPDSVYGNLFRGSSRLLRGATRAQGKADLVGESQPMLLKEMAFLSGELLEMAKVESKHRRAGLGAMIYSRTRTSAVPSRKHALRPGRPLIPSGSRARPRPACRRAFARTRGGRSGPSRG